MVSRDDASTSGGKCTDFTILNASVFYTTIQSNPLRFLCPSLVVSLGFWVISKVKKKTHGKQIVSGKHFLLKNQG